jgi:curved DNA-binding protein CbpA
MAGRRKTKGRNLARFFDWLALFALFFLVDSALAGFSFSSKLYMPEDPYEILGLSRRATIKDIKAAYHQKARDTHPDKNLDNKETAADNFRQVVDAFEILSDPAERRKYDQQKQRADLHNDQRRQREAQAKDKQEKQRKQRMSQLKRNAADAQNRVMRMSSIDQLKTVMLDENGKAERHLFMVFVADKKTETFVDDDLVFPYPFAGKGNNDVWWEDLLQTVKVRYNSDTDLTRFFRVPKHALAKRSGKPHIVFVRKGDALSNFMVYPIKNLQGNQQSQLENWMYARLALQVEFVNHHNVPVKLLKVEGPYATSIIGMLNPGKRMLVVLGVAEQVVVQEVDLDKFPGWTHREKQFTQHNILGKWTITSDGHIDIKAKRCIDKSASCKSFLGDRGYDCTQNHEFMHSMCASTCGVCSEKPTGFLTYVFRHSPIHQWPSRVRGVLQISRVYLNDVEHVLEFRKNAAFACLFFGLLVGISVFIVVKWSSKDVQKLQIFKVEPVQPSKFFQFIPLAVVMFICWCVATAPNLPKWLEIFKHDMTFVCYRHKVAPLSIVAAGILLHMIVSNRIMKVLSGGQTWKSRLSHAAMILLQIVFLFGLIGGAIAITLYYYESTRNLAMISMIMIWKHNMLHIWHVRKNAAFVLLLAGFPVCAFLQGLLSTRAVRYAIGALGRVLPRVVVPCLSVVLYHALMIDRGFKEDMVHVIEYRKNVMFSFGAIGMFTVLAIAGASSYSGLKVRFSSGRKNLGRMKMD